MGDVVVTPVEEIIQYWSNRSPDYDESPGHSLSGDDERTAWLATLRRLLPPPPAHVLDIGTGTGFLALLLAGLGYQVTGVDLSEDMMAIARTKAEGISPAPTFVLDDASDPTFPPETFDAVVCRHVVWTLVDPATAFPNWRRMLRAGGRLVAFDIVRDGTPRPPSRPGYRDELRAKLPFADLTSPEPVLTALGAAGFTDLDASRMDDIEAAQRAARAVEDLHPGHQRWVYVATRPTASSSALEA